MIVAMSGTATLGIYSVYNKKPVGRFYKIKLPIGFYFMILNVNFIIKQYFCE